MRRRAHSGVRIITVKILIQHVFKLLILGNCLVVCQYRLGAIYCYCCGGFNAIIWNGLLWSSWFKLWHIVCNKYMLISVAVAGEVSFHIRDCHSSLGQSHWNLEKLLNTLSVQRTFLVQDWNPVQSNPMSTMEAGQGPLYPSHSKNLKSKNHVNSNWNYFTLPVSSGWAQNKWTKSYGDQNLWDERSRDRVYRHQSFSVNK